MSAFLTAALPWIATGLALALSASSMKDGKGGWLGIGIMLGMLCGIIISRISSIPLEFGISFGMLIGVIIGISKKKY